MLPTKSFCTDQRIRLFELLFKNDGIQIGAVWDHGAYRVEGKPAPARCEAKRSDVPILLVEKPDSQNSMVITVGDIQGVVMKADTMRTV